MNFIKNYLVWVVILIFFVLFSLHSLLNHWNFSTHAWDLGIYDQQTWLYSHFQSIFNTVRGLNLLSDHFGLILYPIGLIYLIYPHAETLLIIQALLVVLSAYPLYLISKKKLNNNLISWVIIIAYLSSIGIRSAIDFDFHLATIAVFFYAYFVYFWLEKKYWWSIAFAFLAVLTKEDMPIYIGFTALGLMINSCQKKDEVKNNFKLLILSLMSFLAIYKIMPVLSFSSFKQNYFDYHYLGNSYIDVIYNTIKFPISTMQKIWDSFINNLVKVNTFKTYFGSFWYLPFFSPDILIFSVPFLLTKFVSDRDVLWTLSAQYGVIGMFILSLATIYTIARLSALITNKKYRNIIVIVWSIFFLIYTRYINFYQAKTTFWDGISPSRWKTINDYSGINQAINLIPKKASVVTQNNIVPHLTNRKSIYLLQCPFCNAPSNRIYNYVLLDTRYGSSFAPKELANIKPLIDELITKGTLEGWGYYELVYKDEQESYSTYLFKNNQIE